MNKSTLTAVCAGTEGRSGSCTTWNAVLSTPPILKLDVVDAGSNPNIARIFYDRKQACYARFGAVAGPTTLADQGAAENVLLVTATDCESLEIVGGIAVYMRSQGARLPVELAIGDATAMQQEIKKWTNQRVAELSCLWAEEAWRKTGLSEHLAHLGLAAAHLLSFDKVMAFGHQHLIKVYETWGFLPEPGLSEFSYPDPSYVSSVSSADAVGFATVPLEKRQRLFGYAEALADHRPILWRHPKEETPKNPRPNTYSSSSGNR